MLCFLQHLGIQFRKRRDDEEQHTETASELSPHIQTDKRDNAVLIEQGTVLVQHIILNYLVLVLTFPFFTHKLTHLLTMY